MSGGDKLTDLSAVGYQIQKQNSAKSQSFHTINLKYFHIILVKKYDD